VTESRLTRVLLRIGALGTLAFLYGPLVVIALYAFNRNVTQKWPIEEYSTRWFKVAFEDEAVR
jgi:putative spermidine/putrescine transport system permease protein